MSDDGLLNVQGYAPAALVVEYNLFEWRRIGNGTSVADQFFHEDDAAYHARLAAHCEPHRKGTLGAVTLSQRARQWSDHYRRLKA